MRYETIADIYSANRKMRERLFETLRQISPDEATSLPDGEKWSIQQITEHVSMVDFGISRICAKLLASAKIDNNPSDGSFALSENFGERSAAIAGLKVEAPERVQPTGNVTIAESLERMSASSESLNSIQTELESFDLGGHKFPHPFFGDLSAGEWLVMAGLHMHRHTEQINALAGRLRQ